MNEGTQKAFIVGGVLVLIAGLLLFMDSPRSQNVVVFAFDGLQAKHLKAYGYPLDTTPTLDAFLARSTLYTNAVSAAPWTAPSFMSIFTSRYPSEHKLTNKLVEVVTATTTYVRTATMQALAPGIPTLAEILKSEGYATAAFTGDAGVKGEYGYSAGFDEYYDATPFGGFDGSIPRAYEWLKKNKDKKFFLFVHGYNVHGQHAPRDGFDYRFVEKPYTGTFTGSPREQGKLREQGLASGPLALSEQDKAFWRAVYDEKIARADEEFGQFLKDLDELGLKENTVVVVVSDHGTEFFEHGRVDHGHTLYGELLNVLFAIHIPGQSGKKVSDLVSTIDLAPTVLSLLRIHDPAVQNMRGVNVLAQNPAHDVYSETDYRMYTHKRSITTTDGWKFILTRETNAKELYDLNTDPTEQKNLLASESVKAYELEQKLLKHLKEVGDTGPWRLGCLPVYADQCK